MPPIPPHPIAGQASASVESIGPTSRSSLRRSTSGCVGYLLSDGLDLAAVETGRMSYNTYVRFDRIVGVDYQPAVEPAGASTE